MSITELAKYIRFQLGELRAQNKHHEFEHLARQFARLRVCENILPATGPVGAGGDKGRDFETYRTYLASTPIATSTFLGLVKDKKLAFTCSLQQDIARKIKSDISVICASGQVVHAIYYFCEADLPIGKRQTLQEWCKETFQADLEVFDGQALSEQLTDMDVFWIAEEYLGVPSESYPRATSTDSAYERYKERWIENDQVPVSFADFSQVKYGLRRATFKGSAKPDLTNWLCKMETYLGSDKSNPLFYRSRYEISVASLRGLNNLTSKREIVEEYFSRIDKLDDIPGLREAGTLLSYCSTAFRLGHFDIDVNKLSKWSQVLIRRVNKAIEESRGPGARCSLYQTRSVLATLPYQNGSAPQDGIDDVFVWWSKLIEEVDKAPLFPLEDFADILTIMTEFLGEDERFLKITQRTDELLTKRSSGYVAAEKCRDRAMAYYEREQYLQAIKQLHQAKIQWFSAETLRGSLLSMLVLCDCYQHLGLIYPAKYYAAGVAFVAHQQDNETIKTLLPRALFMFADCCYQGGEWMNFACIVRWALSAHHMYDESPLNIEDHKVLQRIFVHTAIARTLLKRFDTDLGVHFDEVFANWPLDQGTRTEIENLGDTPGPWSSAPAEELCRTAQTQLAGRPFSDMGERRKISWKALGISWVVEFDNEQMISSISEELVSTLQVILADLAAKDLLLLPTRVLVNTHITDGMKLDVEEIPSNTIATWRVGFPRKWIRNLKALDDLREAVLALAVTVLGKCSMLSADQFLAEIERIFADGLTTKIFSVRPYAELYTEFIPESEFNVSVRQSMRPLFSTYPFEHQEHALLAWNQSDGLGYFKERAREYLKNRYEKGIRPIRRSLPRLLKDQDFLSEIKKLRESGYLDWEILLIVANICVDDRAKSLLRPMASIDEQMRVTKDLIFREETEDDKPISPAIFTEERVAIQKQCFLGSVANTWGLVLHQQTPDFDALERLLDVRYHNSEDDIPHLQLFGSLDS